MVIISIDFAAKVEKRFDLFKKIRQKLTKNARSYIRVMRTG